MKSNVKTWSRHVKKFIFNQLVALGVREMVQMMLENIQF